MSDNKKATPEEMARPGDTDYVQDTAQLTDAHRSFLHGYAITDEVIDLAGISSVEQGWVIPWTDATGTVPVGVFDRDKRPASGQKNTWPKGETTHLNMLRVVEGSKVLLVEGIKQHLAAASYAPADYSVIGMNGCDGVHAKTDLAWAKGKQISVIFDADRLTNQRVKGASERVTALLTKAGAASVSILDVPGKGTDGLDDVLADLRPERRAAWLEKLLTSSTPATDKARLDGYVFDCNDLAALPAPTPLMEGVLDVSTIAMLAGKFGTYKTFLALSWAASLATGRAWGNQAVPVAVPVLYIAAEGVTGIRGRLAAWQSAHGQIPRGMLTVVARPVRLTEESDVAEIRELIASTGARLVVFDTLHRCAPGVEENSAKEMGVVIDRVASLRDDTGCTVLLLHHTGHEGRRARGSSVNEDDIDSSFVVRLTGDEEDRSMDNQRVLEHRKRKDGELLEPVPLKLVVVEGTESGYLEVANVFSTAGDRKEGKVRLLVAKADKMGLAANLSAAKTLDAFRTAGVRISKWESEQIAKTRKSAPASPSTGSPNSPHPHRGDARGVVDEPAQDSLNAPGSFSGNSELGKLDTPRNSPDEPGNVASGHSPEGSGEFRGVAEEILALAKPVPDEALLCETCGGQRELVPPARFWYACPSCHPDTFNRGVTR